MGEQRSHLIPRERTLLPHAVDVRSRRPNPRGRVGQVVVRCHVPDEDTKYAPRTLQRYPAALREYRDLQTLVRGARALAGLRLDGINFEEKLTELKNAEAELRYTAGTQAMQRADWPTAVAELDIAVKYAGGTEYKDATSKIAESHYRWAEAELASKAYRMAAERFATSARSGNFEDGAARAAAIYAALGNHFIATDSCRQAVEDLRRARDLMDSATISAQLAAAEACAITAVAILPLENPTRRNPAGMAIADTIADGVSAKVRARASQYVRLIEREALDQILREHGLSRMGVQAASRGKLLGVRYLVVGKLTQVKVDNPRPTEKRHSLKGSEVYECQKRTKRGVISTTCRRDVPVQYTLHQAQRRIRLVGAVKVLDTKTGEQLKTIPFDVLAADEVAYADRFRPSDTGMAYNIDDHPTSLFGSNTEKKLASARTTLKDETTLLSELLPKIVDTVARGVLSTVDVRKAVQDPVELVVE